MRWRPKVLDRKAQPEIEERSEDCRSGSSKWVGGGLAIEVADKTGEQSRKRDNENYKTVEETIGGLEGVDAGGQAEGDAGSDDEGKTCCGEGGMGQLGGQVATYITIAGVDAEGKMSSGKAVGGTESSGEVTDKANETGGQSRTQNFGLDKAVEETRGGSEVVGSGGSDGIEAESAEDGEIRLTRGVEGLGQPEDQITPPWHCADDAAGGISGPETMVGGTERAGEVVVYTKKPVQQIDKGKEGEASKNLGEVARANTTEE